MRQIGKGSFGSVFLVGRRSDGAQFVLKKMAIKNVPQKELDAYQNEVTLLSELQHPSIVSYVESFLDQASSHMCIVMSYCEGGDLSHFLTARSHSSQPLPEAEVLYHLVQMLLALLFMHDKHILHRDLKTQNVFIKNGLLQLGDLGISKALGTANDFASTCIGTPYYMSPELFKNKPYNHKSDVWALGCVLYEMCCMKHAFDASSLNGLAAKIMKGGYHGIGPQYSRHTRELIGAMLSVNPAARPSVREILGLAFMRRHVTRFVHVVCRHVDFYREADVHNFVRQIQRLGFADMLSTDAPAPAPSAPKPVDSPAVRNTLEQLGLEERERQRMERKLTELKELQAERERRVREKERAKDREVAKVEKRRSGGKDGPVAGVAVVGVGVERRREEESSRRKEEEGKRRREREKERERLLQWEKEKDRQREADDRKRRLLDLIRERERRDADLAVRRQREAAAAQLSAKKAAAPARPEAKHGDADAKAEWDGLELEKIRREREALERRLEAAEGEAMTEKERVLRRKELEKRERERQQTEQLSQARRDYSHERVKAIEWNKAVVHGHPILLPSSSPAPSPPLSSAPHPPPPQPHPSHPQPDPTPSSAADEEEEEDDVERADMEDGRHRIELLTAHLREYGQRLQTLRTTVQVTALIQEASADLPASDDDVSPPLSPSQPPAEPSGVGDLFVSIEERMRLLGRECVRLMGRELFVRVYDWVRECKDRGEGGEEIEAGLGEKEGKGGDAEERWKHWPLVDQLIFMEEHCEDDEDAQAEAVQPQTSEP